MAGRKAGIRNGEGEKQPILVNPKGWAGVDRHGRCVPRTIWRSGKVGIIKAGMGVCTADKKKKWQDLRRI